MSAFQLLAPAQPTAVLSDIILRLTAENEQLRGRLEVLETHMLWDTYVPPIFGFTDTENRMFAVLMNRNILSKEVLYASCYASSGHAPELKVVDVYICRIRKKIKPFGVEIKTLWGQGYFLEPRMKAAVQTLYDAAAKEAE